MASNRNDTLGSRSNTQDTWRSQSSTFAPPTEKAVSFDVRSRSNMRCNTTVSNDTWRSQSASFEPPIERTVGRGSCIHQLLCTPVTRYRFETKAAWRLPAPDEIPWPQQLQYENFAGSPPRRLSRRISEVSLAATVSTLTTRSRSWDSLTYERGQSGISGLSGGSWDSLNLERVPREAKRKDTCASAVCGAVARSLEIQFEQTAQETVRLRQRRMSVPAVPTTTRDMKHVLSFEPLLTEEDDHHFRRVKTWPEFGVRTGCLDKLLREQSDYQSEPSPKVLGSIRKSRTQEIDGARKKARAQQGAEERPRINFFRFRFQRAVSAMSSASTMGRFLMRAGTAFSSLSSNPSSLMSSWFGWNESAQSFFREDGARIGFCWAFALLVSTLVLSAVLLVLLSDIIGVSERVYLLLLRHEALSMPLLGGALLGLVALHVSDVYSWAGRPWKRISPVVCMLYLGCVGIIFMTKSYPEIPLIVSFLHFPVWIGGVRVASSGYWASYSFHLLFARCCGVAGITLAILWPIWLTLDSKRHGGGFTEKRLRQKGMQQIFQEYDVIDWEQCRIERNEIVPRADLLDNCARIELFAFFSWTCPALESAVLLSIAVFLLLRSSHLRRHDLTDSMDDVEARNSDDAREDKSLQRILFVVFVFIGAAWAACAVAGSSMGLSNTVFLGLGSGALVFFIWLIASVRFRDVVKKAHESMLWRILRPFAKSDWTKAFILCCTNVFVAAFLTLEFLTRSFERLCGMKKGPLKYTTARGAWLMNSVSSWHVTSVLTKAWWLSMLFLLIWVVCTKMCLVLLAWMIDYSQEFHWLSVLALFYAVALTLFLCPTMPVVPIYMSAGILIVARLREEVGFAWAVIATCGLCLVLKLNACALQQKLFGKGLGHFTSVRRIVGLHTVATRAVELILQQPGFTFAKVAILVGGPDWPTSVLTGIMGLNLWQMLLGTLPVIFLILPTVLAGSCLLDEEVKKFSPVVTGTMGIAHGSAFIAALVLTARKAVKHHAELRRSRAEHKDLEEKARKSEQRKSQLTQMTGWMALSYTQRTSLCLAVALMFACCWMSTLLSSRCFRAFSLDSDISDTFEEGGLEGNAWNLLKPLGVASSCLALAGLICFLWYSLESAFRLHYGDQAACAEESILASRSFESSQPVQPVQPASPVSGACAVQAASPLSGASAVQTASPPSGACAEQPASPLSGVSAKNALSPSSSEGPREDLKTHQEVFKHDRPQIVTPRTPPWASPIVVSPREPEPWSP